MTNVRVLQSPRRPTREFRNGVVTFEHFKTRFEETDWIKKRVFSTSVKRRYNLEINPELKDNSLNLEGKINRTQPKFENIDESLFQKQNKI